MLRSCLPALALTLGLAFTPAAKADEPAKVDEGAPAQVTMQVVVVNASAAPGGLDPKIERLRASLAKFNFASYKVVQEKTAVLGPATTDTTALPGGRSLALTPLRFEKSGRVQLRLFLSAPGKPKILDAKVMLDAGKDTVVGGPATEDGSTLFVVLHNGP